MTAVTPLLRTGGVQVVKTKAIRLHCQSAPSAALEIGSGDARLTDSSAATQVNVTIAATSTTPLRVQRLEIMALVPGWTAQNHLLRKGHGGLLEIALHSSQLL